MPGTIYSKQSLHNNLISSIKKDARDAVKLYFSPIAAAVSAISKNIKAHDGSNVDTNISIKRIKLHRRKNGRLSHRKKNITSHK